MPRKINYVHTSNSRAPFKIRVLSHVYLGSTSLVCTTFVRLVPFLEPKIYNEAKK